MALGTNYSIHVMPEDDIVNNGSMTVSVVDGRGAGELTVLDVAVSDPDVAARLAAAFAQLAHNLRQQTKAAA